MPLRTLARVPAAGTAPLALAIATGLVGCNNMDRRYLSPEDSTVYALAFTPDTEPLFEGEEENLYALETEVDLPIRMPTDAEASALGDAPWVNRGDYYLEVTFTLTNLDTTATRVVSATLNGISPDYVYVPGFTEDEGEAVPDFSQWERTYALAPGESRTVTIREEELDEVAVDLASATSTEECGYLANLIVYFANQSGIDARSTACMPPVIPNLVGFNLGIRALAAEPPPIVLEASVMVRDVHDRIAAPGQEAWVPPEPTAFTPPAPPEE